MTGKSNPRAYSIARRIIAAVGTGRPSSETATIPASFISPISASSVPSEFLVTAPIGSTLARLARPACSITNRVTAALSFTGVVFGIAQVHVHVDETGRDDQSGRIENFRAIRNRIAVAQHADHSASFDEKIL